MNTKELRSGLDNFYGSEHLYRHWPNRIFCAASRLFARTPVRLMTLPRTFNRIAPAIQPALEDQIPKRIKLVSILLEHPRVLACHQIG